MRTALSDETNADREFAPAAQVNHGAIPNQCPVCEGRASLLVAIPTPSSLVAYFTCDNCAVVKIVQR